MATSSGFPQASTHPSLSGSSQPVSYLVLRQHHKRAYDFLSIALEMDEEGTGDKSAAIDYYSRGVAALEEGIACDVYAQGEEKEKAERLKDKMISNLEMARNRVNVLLSGAELKGMSGHCSGVEPTESLRIHQVTPREPLRNKKKSNPLGDKVLAGPSKSRKNAEKNEPKARVNSRRSNPSDSDSKSSRPPKSRSTIGKSSLKAQRPRDGKDKADAAPPHRKPPDLKVNNLKGVDSKLAEKILDELVDQSETAITWDDVVGLELPKRTLQEIVILPALRPELFTGLRSPARGLLLFGPPGNGKTMLAKAVAHESQAKFFNISASSLTSKWAKAVAHESQAKFFNISASSLTSKWVGEGEKLVKALFALARELQPSIIFLDEVDALLSRRGESEHDAMRRIKNEFLQAFDGMHSAEGERILVMAATNRPHELDDAALRRFEKRIYIPLPASEARKTVLKKLLTRHRNSLSESQINRLASATDGFSGSDLTALAKDAALGPIRELDYSALKSVPANKVRPICLSDFEHSMRQIRPSVARDLIHTLEEWNALYGVSS